MFFLKANKLTGKAVIPEISVSSHWLGIISALALSTAVIAAPSPTSVTTPAVSTTGCDGLADTILRTACKKRDPDTVLVLAIDRLTGTNPLEVYSQLILVDGREGKVPADSIAMKYHQILAGTGLKPSQTILELKPGNSSFIYMEDDTTLANLTLASDPKDPPLDFIEAFSNTGVLIENVIIEGVKDSGLVKWTGGCYPDNLIKGSTFEIPAQHHFGLLVACIGAANEPAVTSSENRYLIGSGSAGIKGSNSMLVDGDRFVAAGDDVSGYEQVHPSSGERVSIENSTFTAGEHSGFTAIKLVPSSYPPSCSPSKCTPPTFTIANNTFEVGNNGKAVKFGGDENLGPESTCNHWVEDPKLTPAPTSAGKRCEGAPASGFLHFDDGFYCAAPGEKPTSDTLSRIDCNPPTSPAPTTADAYKGTTAPPTGNIISTSLSSGSPGSSRAPARPDESLGSSRAPARPDDDKTVIVSASVSSGVVAAVVVTVIVLAILKHRKTGHVDFAFTGENPGAGSSQ